MEQENLWEELMDVREFDHLFDSIFADRAIRTENLLNNIFQGKQALTLDSVKEIITNVILGEWIDIKDMFFLIILIMVLGNILQNIGEIFSKNGMKESADYMMMIFLSAVLMKGFIRTGEIVRITSDEMLTFIKLLIPAYFVAIGSVSGMTVVTTFYQMFIMAIGLIEQLLIGVLIPSANLLVVIFLMDAILGGEHLKSIGELLEKGIQLCLKAVLSFGIGYSMIQNIITPVIGKVNRNFLEKTLAVIPGIGDVSESVTSILTGSAILIKNTLGAFGMVVIVLICITPICRIMLIAGSMKIAGAIGSVLGKSRLIQCTNRISDGCFLLGRIMFTIATLFFLLIAMVAFSTNRGL